MANVLAVNDILELRYVCQLGPQFSINVRHWRVKTINAGSPTDEDVAIRQESLFSADYKAVMSNSALFYGVSAQLIKPTKRPFVPSILLRGNGAVNSDPLPPQVAGLISFRTALAGRKNRGRSYIPFAPETESGVTGQPDVVYLGNLSGLATDLSTQQTHVNGGRSVTVEPVLYHRGTGAADLITGFTSRVSFGTQRRRSLVNRPDVPPF